MLEALALARGQDVKAFSADWSQLDQKERRARLAGEVLKQVRNDPAGTLRRRLQAGLVFIFGEEWRHGVLWKSSTAEGSAMPAWLAASYPALLYGVLLGMLALGLLGWRWTYGWRAQAMPSSLALVWVPLPYVLSHAEALSGPRLPLDGILLCYASFAIVYLIPPIGATLWPGAGYQGEQVEKK